MKKKPVFLSIAGSDSGGSAGIQADTRVAVKLGFAAANCISAVTAQNPDSLDKVFVLPPDIIKAQLDALFSYYNISVVKCGMIANKESTQIILKALKKYFLPVCKIQKDKPDKKKGFLIVDPVLASSSGKNISSSSFQSEEQEELFSLASLVTPNIPECEKLLNIKIEGLDKQKEAAELFYKKYQSAVLLKGGHNISSEASNVIDIFYNGNEMIELSAPLVKNINSHGSGCVYASALGCMLYQKDTLSEALVGAKDFMQKTFERAFFTDTINEQSAFLNIEFSLTEKD